MKKYRLSILIVLGALILTIGMLMVINNYIRINTEQASDSSRADTTIKGFSFSSIKNYEAIRTVLVNREKYPGAQDAGNYGVSLPFHKLYLKNIYETTIDNKKIQIGKLMLQFGDGSFSGEEHHFLIVDGVMYGSMGASIEMYPVEQTNWKNILRKISMEQLIPFEQTIKNILSGPYLYNPEDPNIKFTKLDIYFDISEVPTRVVITTVFGQSASEGLFKKIDDQATVIFKENKYSKNPATQNNILKGRAAGKQTVLMRQTYDITYPVLVNSISVVTQSNGPDSQSFTIIDRPDSAANFFCTSYESPEVGPKTAIMPVVGARSQSKVLDWGMRSVSGSETLSFTTNNEHCEMNAWGLFGLDMFSIELP